MPKISVIIPVFNDQRGINACLVALARQTLPASSFEVIVVDNDSSPPILLNTTGQSIHLIHCPHPGSYSARNFGITKAKGEILAFTDADCQPEEDWLKHAIAPLIKDANIIVGGDVLVSTRSSPNALELYQKLTAFDQRKNIEELGFSVTANLIARKTIFDHIGTFDEELLAGGDLEWCWRAKQAGYAIHHQESAAVYTPARTSLSDAIRQARRVQGGRIALRKKNRSHAPEHAVGAHRGTVASFIWILQQRELNTFEKLRVLMVAATLKGSRLIENFRLMLGQEPERR